MALQLGNLRDALKEAGASDESARQAAEEVAAYENRLIVIDQRISELRAYVDLRISELRAYVDQRFTAIDGRLNLLTWMAGTSLALDVAIIIKLFVH
jgi:hypothetical protein